MSEGLERLPVEGHLALGERFEAAEDSQQYRLAHARRALHEEDTALGDREALASKEGPPSDHARHVAGAQDESGSLRAWSADDSILSASPSTSLKCCSARHPCAWRGCADRWAT